MTRRPEPHYITPIRTVSWPRQFIYLDTEATRTRVGQGEEQTWRCGVAACDRRSHRSGEWLERSWISTTNPTELWDWVQVACGATETTVLVCHNLSYDLRIADMLRHLGARGWELQHIMLEREIAWVKWRRGRAVLVACDLTTIVPQALDQIGGMLGLGKPPLPNQHATQAEWLARCRADVEILAAAWRDLADWLDLGGHGSFQPTGAGLAWSIWRHEHLTAKVLARPEDTVAAAVRRAAWTGRAEAWQHGRFTQGPYVEWDYTSAYGLVGLHDTVPTNRVDQLRALPVDRARVVARHRKLLVDLEVTQETPVLPCELDGLVCWPVGTFRTTVWWGEAEDAIRAGATVRVLRAWSWRDSPALASFMGWAIGYADGLPDDVTPLRATVAKHWTRTLVGRCGLRYTQWDHHGGYPWPGWRTGLVYEPGAGPPRRELLLGTDHYLEAGRVEGDDSAPQIMSYVMSQTRRLLWRAMRVAGLDQVLHVDTDGLLVGPEGDQRLEAAGLAGLRRKRAYRELEIVGTRQIILEGHPRAAGLQRKAVAEGELTYLVEEWERPLSSLAGGRPDRVRVIHRRKRLVGNDLRRVRLRGGATTPRWVGLGAGGETIPLDDAPLGPLGAAETVGGS